MSSFVQDNFVACRAMTNSLTVTDYTDITVLTTSIAAVVNKKALLTFARDPSLPIKGVVDYQSCTSKVCFPPVSVPVEWNIHPRQLDRDRIPEAIRHK